VNDFPGVDPIRDLRGRFATGYGRTEQLLPCRNHCDRKRRRALRRHSNETCLILQRYFPCRKSLVIEVVSEGDERYLLKIFADGREERVPIVKRPRKPARFPYRKQGGQE